MTRQPLIAGNWKMNGLVRDSVVLSSSIGTWYSQGEKKSCDMLICPPFALLAIVKEALRDSGVFLGAQDCHMNNNGAHTGDNSAELLKDVGCSHVLVGHSERRTDHNESDAIVKDKAEAALNAGLVAVVCIGETLGERDAGQAIEVNSRQVRQSMPKDANADNVVIAYEPVWAIGTGRIPSLEDVQEMHKAIRAVISDLLGHDQAEKMKILYGGSMKPENAADLIALPDVDGGLIGGASLKADDFINIAKSCS